MKLCMISFTENGRKLSEYVAEKLKEKGKAKSVESKGCETEGMQGDIAGEYHIDVLLYTKYKDVSIAGKKEAGETNETGEAGKPGVAFVETAVGEWAKVQMKEKNAMLFIGACGIAVRAVAPYLNDKLHDSAVLVMDEMGSYVIPILSGHMGGANELALFLAVRTGAEPVITTATDINHRFAADMFAKNNGLFIVNKEGIAKVSAKALAGKKISISIETGHAQSLSERGNNLAIVPYPPAQPVDILVATEESRMGAGAGAELFLCPKEYVIGIGCKKGKSAEEIEAFIVQKIESLGIRVSQIYALASVSNKKDEKGILSWCNKERIAYLTYTAEELQEVRGEFSVSSFVKDTVGVDNVCERAALRACGRGGELLCKKYARNGMTIAVAKREWYVRVEEEG